MIKRSMMRQLFRAVSSGNFAKARATPGGFTRFSQIMFLVTYFHREATLILIGTCVYNVLTTVSR